MFRTLLPLAITLGLFLTLPVRAEDKPTPAARLQAIQKEVDAAEKAFRDAWAKLPDIHQEDPEVEKLFQAFRKKQVAGFETALEIAKANPKSDAGFAALEWLLTTPVAYHQPIGKQAMELMAEHHATNPKVGKAIAMLAYYPPTDNDPNYPAAMALMKAVAEKNPDKTARGQAALGLAWQANRKFHMAESRGKNDTDRLAGEAEKAFETVLRDYGECPNLRTRGARPATATLAEEVDRELYELRHLRIGKPAPDIEGEDLDGAKFKLSDYRGKVVLLVFWASWCGPCMGAVPHEKELVEHFKGRPFVLIGVNGDPKKEDAQKAIAKHKIPWRSFYNGTEGPGGPIAVAWNVRGWPTVYVIDHQGTIRHKYLHGKRLDEPLEKLVTEAEPPTHTKDTADAVKKSVAEGKAVLLDVREQAEWDRGHLQDARLLPLSVLQANPKADDVAKLIPREKIVYCHCASGIRCLKAAATLKKLGYDVRALKPGYKDLLKAGFTPATK